MKLTKTIALLAALVIACAAFSQDGGGPPPPGDQAGSPPGGGPGGPGAMQMRRGPMGGPMILNLKAVQKELKLTDDQVSQLKEIMPGRRPPSDDGDQSAPPKRLTRQEMDDKIKSILNSDQYTRYKQLDLQASGPMAFSRPEVVEKLGLSADQKTQIQTIIRADRQTPPEMNQGADMRAAMKERRENLMKKISAVLTEDQKATWKTMVGDKFEFPEMGPRRGPGGPGGPPPSDGGGAPPPPPDGGG